MNTALLKKLHYPLGGKALLLHTPDPSVPEQLGLSAEDAEQADAEAKAEAEAGTFDFVLLFARDTAALNESAPLALKAVKRDGLLWICYPKGTSKMKSDLNRDRGWAAVASEGWEGVSLVSFDEIWSAMRFRPAGQSGSGRSGRADTRSAAAAAVGSQPLEAPADLNAALAAAPEAEAYFNGLAPSHRKEYIRWITEAKREETRAVRISGAVDKLLQKLKRPSDKPQN
ncbi:YdeI/OmpD-associated family protein [Paenibacillus humicola]|uniref:YdeI/OmpD-associated family protein n=1 Tax=Paenibacillus humicola TaxID=3110540 RepID=UPI00237AB3F6|nr:YdeI/OmpD-associated family protein [Paenibacillus humicola]